MDGLSSEQVKDLAQYLLDKYGPDLTGHRLTECVSRSYWKTSLVKKWLMTKKYNSFSIKSGKYTMASSTNARTCRVITPEG